MKGSKTVGTKQNPSFETARQILNVLTMHYSEAMRQSEIASKLGLSTATVNRMIKQGKDLGMVQITLTSPYQRLSDIEAELIARWSIERALVTPAVTQNVESKLQQVARVGGAMLRDVLKDGDTIAISGGKAVSALVEALEVETPLNVNVVPLTGCAPNFHYTDVNHVATRLAEKLGGTASLIHAPLFAETAKEREMITDMKAVNEVFEKARNADVAIVGIGSLFDANSTYYEITPKGEKDRNGPTNSDAIAEYLGHLINAQGQLSDVELNKRLVAVDPQDSMKIPNVIGIASGNEKAEPITAVLNGGFLNTLVTDEDTAQLVLATPEA